MKLIRKIRRSINKILAPRYDFEKEYKKIPDEFEFPQFENPLVSIIIPTYNQYKYTKSCLWSILKNTKIPYEIIIGDDLSTDETKSLEERIRRVTVIRHKNPSGFLKNVNKTVPHARGKYIILLNNDVVVMPNWLEPLVDEIEKDPTIGLIAGRYYFASGRLQEAGTTIYSDGHIIQNGHAKYEIYDEYSRIKEVDYCSGCGILLRKSDWEKLNGFDENFTPAYYEDTDLAMRIKYELGLKIIYHPDSKLIHFGGASYSNNAVALVEQNREKFVQKWSEKLQTYPEYKV